MNVFRSFAYILSDSVVHEKGYFFTNKLLWALFIPLLIEQALEFFVGLADSTMVASLGEVAISGVSLVDFFSSATYLQLFCTCHWRCCNCRIMY